MIVDVVDGVNMIEVFNNCPYFCRFEDRLRFATEDEFDRFTFLCRFDVDFDFDIDLR